MRNLTLIILSLLLMMSCSVSKQNISSLEIDKKEPNLISFLVLNIYRDTISSTNVIEFISKIESTGAIKKQHSFPTQYYLTFYAYSGKHIVDSLIIEHPLYKHLEYVDENRNFAVKDTIINHAEFFVRLQGHFNEIKIFETLKNKSPIKLNTIKF